MTEENKPFVPTKPLDKVGDLSSNQLKRCLEKRLKAKKEYKSIQSFITDAVQELGFISSTANLELAKKDAKFVRRCLEDLCANAMILYCDVDDLVKTEAPAATEQTQ